MTQILLITVLVVLLFPWARRRLFGLVGRVAGLAILALLVFLVVVVSAQ